MLACPDCVMSSLAELPSGLFQQTSAQPLDWRVEKLMRLCEAKGPHFLAAIPMSIQIRMPIRALQKFGTNLLPR